MSIVEKAKKNLDKDENILSYIECSLRTFVYRQVYRPGIMLATNKRLYFYGKNLGDIEFIESYSYDKITSINESKGILKSSITINIEGDSIKISDVLSGNKDEFIRTVNKKWKQ